MINIIGKRFWFFLISGIVILAGIGALIGFSLKPGVEFTSGSEVTITFPSGSTVTKSELVSALADLGYSGSNAIVRKAGADFIVDLPLLDDASRAALTSGLTEKLGTFQNSGFEQVTRQSAGDVTRNAGIAVVLASIGMLIYISWAFRRMPNPFRWGTCAIIAMVHDLLVVVGVFALLGGVFGWQIDLMFVAGVLTVIGYSVNDTIVIFDRIREGVRRNPGLDLETVVNRSLVETMSRTLITGIGVLFVLIALMIVVGGPIQNLIVVLLVGIITGTYSSFGTAASLLVVWEKGEWGRFIGKKASPVVSR
jgi:preprotein translocase subunit SecF